MKHIDLPHSLRAEAAGAFDVAIVGAGPGGIPAAIAAAREGASVILLEEDMKPGGAPVDMFVTFLCGNPRVGIFREMIQALNAEHDLTYDPAPNPWFGTTGGGGRNWWYHPDAFVQVITRMIDAEPNLTLYCGAQVVGAVAEKRDGKNHVSGVRFLRNGQLQEVQAKITIDATGTGLVAASAGCEWMYGTDSMSDFGESVGVAVGDGRVQPCTWMFMAQKIRRDAVFPLEKLKGSSGMESGETTWLVKDRLPEIVARDKGIYLFWGTTVNCEHTYDPLQVAAAQQQGLKKLEHNIAVITQAGFSVTLAPKAGIRECRRIVGDYILTAEDLIDGRFPSDTVAHASYALDAWGMKIPEEVKHIPPYGIPYRSLTPRNTEGLLTSGRIISGTKIAHSSYRVQPICHAIGEAAGTAAAMCALQNKKVREINITELRAKLQAKGMFAYNEQ
jgi:hypothetical protein